MKRSCGSTIEENLMRFSPDFICKVNRKGQFISTNDACQKIIGYEREELINCKVFDFLHPNDRITTVRAGKEIIQKSKTTYLENSFFHKTGKEVPILWSIAWSEHDEAFLCIGRDASELKRIRQRLKEKDALHNALIEHGSEMIALFDEELNYLYAGGSFLKELGYYPGELLGINALGFVHPEDLPKISESLAEVLKTEEQIKVSEFRFRDSKGNWRWLETTASNQLQNSAVKAIVTSSRDITERVVNRLKIQESKQRFKSLFDYHIDIVLFQDKNGTIIDVNPATLSFFKIQKQEILNRPFSDFLGPEIIQTYEGALQDALNGKSVSLKISIPFEGLGLYHFDIAKIPVEVNGEVIGVYSILRDISEISQSNNTIKRQAKKMNSILESITDAFFTIDRHWNLIYANREFEKLFDLKSTDLSGKKVWDYIPDEVNVEFYTQLKTAFEAEKTVHFEGFFEKHRKWLEVKAFPSEEGLSIFIDDITERIKSRQELEKLSFVASKTINGVVITDANGLVEWVNEGFTRLTGYTFGEVVGKNPNFLLLGKETDKATIEQIEERLKQGKHFNEEVFSYKKSGEKVWFLVDIAPVLNEFGEVAKFIAIQTDITERKEAEDRQFQMTQDLYTQNRDLQEFTYMMSHNFRSPVASILGLTDLLTTKEKDSETYNMALGYLKKTAEQLDTVLRDINLMLSIREKRDTSTLEKVKLAPICQQAITSQQELLEECGGKVVLNIEEGVKVSGNKAYLYSIFYNLLSNSIKYRSQDRPLKVYIKWVGSTERGTLISFSDNGSGFDTEKAGDNVFKLYKRFHTNPQGRGFGLFLVKAHIEAMEGFIEVKSEVNKGTTFLIFLR